MTKPRRPPKSAEKSRNNQKKSPSLGDRAVRKASHGKTPESDIAEPAAPGVLKFPVVGMGASAGGFEALCTVFKHLPAGTGMGFVVVMHLDPHHKSKLTELLARCTEMPVREIRSGMLIEKNSVHILPSNTDVLMSGKCLRLVPRPRADGLHMPIDRFFVSLAEHHGARAMGVVLSGTGTDGTAGLGAIKAAGGMTFAEAEASAKYFGMPRSAIDAGCADAVLTAKAIGVELARISRHPLVHPRTRAKAAHAFPETADALGKIFFLLRQNSAVDFTLYKHTTLRRRISRRMVLQHLERVDDYVSFLRSNPGELDALFQDLLINVTNFFRDKKVYAALKKKIVPRILEGKAEGGEVRVWVPGCATGEEAYSLAMCLTEEITRSTRNLKLQVFATDLSEAAITRGRAGLYPFSIAKDVSPERLRRFFIKTTTGYQISRTIRDMCTFARQNLCEDPPFSRLDLISCRNVLIYLGPELQKKCMPVFHYALRPGGFLMLGTSETVGTAADLFLLIDKPNKIYARKQIAAHPSALEFSSKGLAPVRSEPLARPAPVRGDTPDKGPIDLHAQTDRIILDHYAPSGVIIDTHLRVQEFRGRTGWFLEHAPGTATLNLLQMVRSSMVLDLRAAIHKALKDKAPVRKTGVPLKTNGHAREVRIDVVPFSIAQSSETWLLVLFEETQPAEESSELVVGRRGEKRAADKRDAEILRLRTDLDANRESLQAIIEEQEATNEELKSANEEIESSNEELQSTNEELETAKEELQSTNEELTTLNEELSNRNVETAQMNNDLTNLLSSINIPIIMVDKRLAVRRVTPLAEKVFNIIPSDIGRRLSDLKSNLTIGNLDGIIHDVIDTLATRENKVQDAEGRWYSLRVRPYRTRDNVIDGAVITLVDIHEEQRMIERLELVSQYSAAILETIHEPLVVLDPELRVRDASRAFYEAFRLTRKKVRGLRFTELNGGEWNVLNLRKLLEEILPKHKRLNDFKAEINLSSLGRRQLVFNARRLDHKGESLVLLAIEDVTRLLPVGSADGRRR